MKKLLMFFLLIYTYCISQEGWIELNSPTNKKLEFIDFIDKDLGIFGGDSCLFITTDGGISFKSILTEKGDIYYYKGLFDSKKNICLWC